MINRYNFTKEKYSDYVIIIVRKKLFYSFGIDNKILSFIKFNDKISRLRKRCINYLVLDDLDIIDINKYEDNKYYKYYLLVYVNDILDKIKYRNYELLKEKIIYKVIYEEVIYEEVKLKKEKRYIVNNNIVLLRKMGGFYVCFDSDAIILSFLCDYKIKNSKVGFPINALDKVVNILENNSVSYIVKCSEEEVSKNIFGKKNKYKYYLDLGKKKIDFDYRINKIVNRISEMNEEDINNILDMIESKIYE